MTPKIEKLVREDIYEAVTRVLVTRGNAILSSIKEGDHINFLDEAWNDDDENYNEFINAEYHFISIYDLINQAQRSALGAKRYKDNDFYIPEIRRIYKVVRIEKEVPIVVELLHPNEKNRKVREISLAQKMNDFTTSLTDCGGDDKEQIEALEKFFDVFATLDKDYVDTILLDSEYVPYASTLPMLASFKESLVDEEKERRKEAAKEAARVRAFRKEESRNIDIQFAHMLVNLAKSDLQFAKRKIEKRGR